MKFPTALALCVFVTVAALLEPAKARTCKQPDNLTFVQGKRHCLAIKTFHGTTGADTLFVVLHGDLSRGGPADYIFPVGEAIAQRGMPAVVMMRPGYTGDGRTSTGRSTRSQRRGEVYLKSEMDSIAVAVAELKAHHEVERVVMVGHSGGALISGVLLGRKPDLVDAVVLIACPCDVPRWRRVRGRRPLTLAQSPHKWLERVAADAKIFAITGSKDKNTFPDLPGTTSTRRQPEALTPSSSSSGGPATDLVVGTVSLSCEYSTSCSRGEFPHVTVGVGKQLSGSRARSGGLGSARRNTQNVSSKGETSRPAAPTTAG